MTKDYRHFGWECSPYSSKTRAYFRFKGIPHEDIYPNIIQLKRVVEKRVGFIVMPTVITPENQMLQDSSEIIDILEKRHPEPNIRPPGPCLQMASLLLELFADEWMPIISMHTRWNLPENTNFAKTDFGFNAVPWLPAFVRKQVGGVLAKKMQGYLPILGITPKTQPAIETWMNELFDALDAHLQKYMYLFGGRPCLGDFALYGPIFAHVRRDPGSRHQITSRTHLNAWVLRLRNPTGVHGEFMMDDEVPATLDSVFRRLFLEQFPLLHETVARVSQWRQEHPDEVRFPRSLGDVEFKLGDVSETRRLTTFPLWMFQRPLGYYRSISSEERSGVDAFLRRVGGYEAMQIELPLRLTRKNFRVVVA